MTPIDDDAYSYEDVMVDPITKELDHITTLFPSTHTGAEPTNLHSKRMLAFIKRYDPEALSEAKDHPVLQCANDIGTRANQIAFAIGQKDPLWELDSKRESENFGDREVVLEMIARKVDQSALLKEGIHATIGDRALQKFPFPNLADHELPAFAEMLRDARTPRSPNHAPLGIPHVSEVESPDTTQSGSWQRTLVMKTDVQEALAYIDKAKTLPNPNDRGVTGGLSAAALETFSTSDKIHAKNAIPLFLAMAGNAVTVDEYAKNSKTGRNEPTGQTFVGEDALRYLDKAFGDSLRAIDYNPSLIARETLTPVERRIHKLGTQFLEVQVLAVTVNDFTRRRDRATAKVHDVSKASKTPAIEIER